MYNIMCILAHDQVYDMNSSNSNMYSNYAAFIVQWKSFHCTLAKMCT